MTRFESTIENANRALYGTARRRTFFFKGLTVLLAVQMFFFGMAPSAWAAGLIAQRANENGWLQGGVTHDFGSGTLLEGGDNVRLVNSMDSDALTTDITTFRGTSRDVEWDIVGGELHSGGPVYFLNFGKLNFGGGTLDIPSLVAAAMDNISFSPSANFKAGDVFPDSSISGNPGVPSILIAETVTASGDTIVGTKGMDSLAEITIPDGGGKITFKGTMGGDSVLRAGEVEFADVDSSTHSTANGTVDVGNTGTVAGDFQQSGGTISARTFSGNVTQTDAGATIANAGNIVFQGTLTQNAAATVNANGGAGTITLAGGTVNDANLSASKLIQAGGSLTVSDNSLSVAFRQEGGTANIATLSGGVEQKAGSGSSITATAISGGVVQETGNAGSISASTVEGTVSQSAGTINAGTFGGNVTQTGVGATIANAGNIVFQGTLTQSATAMVNANSGAGTVTLAGGTVNDANLSASKLIQTGGSLAVSDNSLSVAFRQEGGTASIATLLGGVEQKAGSSSSITATTISGGVVQESGNSGSITATTVNDGVTQSAGIINATTVNGTVEQGSGGTIRNQSGNLTFNTAFESGKQQGTISSSETLTLAGGDKLSGIVSAKNLKAGTGTGNITQDAGTITVTETLTAGKFTQTGGTASFDSSAATISQKTDSAGSITATTLSGNVTQEAENAGTINATTLSETVTQNGGMIAGKDGGDLTLTHAITTQKGTLSAEGATLTLADGSELSGNVSAKNLTAGTGNITQKAGQINVTQTLTAGTFTQNGAAATQTSPATTATAATIAANVEQKGAGTIGAAGQNVTFNGDVKQEESGSIVGSTVTATGNITQEGSSGITADWLKLGSTDSNNAQVYNLVGSGNKVDALSSFTVKSIEIDNRNNPLAIGKATEDTHYGINTTDGLTIKSAGAVTDAGSGVVESKIKIDSAQSVTLRNSTKFEVAGISSVGNVSIDTGTSIIEPTSLTLSGAISSTEGNVGKGNVGIKTQSFTQNGNAISGKNVTIIGIGDGGLTVNGNVTASATATGDGDILIKSESGDVKTTAAATLDSKKGSVVLQGKNVEVNGTKINAKTAGEGVGIEALDDSDTTDPTKGTVTIKGNAQITSEKVVLVAPGDLTVESGVAMGKTAAANKDADLTVLTDNALKMGLDAGSRPTKNVRIAGAKSMDADLNQEITLAQFAINAESLPELKFSEATERISIESTGDVKLTTKSDVTIFNNVADGASASVEAKNVVDSADDPVKVQAGVPEDKAAHGLVGKTINMTAGGAVTVEDGAIVSVSQGDLVLATPNNKNFTIQNGALVQSQTGDVTLTSGGAMVADGRIVSGTVTVGENQTVMNGTATTVGAVTLEAAGDVDVGKTGKVEGKNDVTLTSDNDDVNVLGTVISTDGDVAMSATADGKSVKIGDAGSTPAVAATVSAGNDVILTGGRGVLALGGSEITAANAVSATAKEFIVTDADIEGAGKVTLTTTDAQTLTAATGGYSAGDPAGVLVQGGSIQSTGDAVEMTAAGSVIVANGATVAAKTTLDLTANGESDDTTVQGVKLAGAVAAEGKGTIKAEKGSIEQTAGSLATGALDFKAKDINQTGGRVTATGAATAEATDGSVILAQANNDFDFQNGLDVTAKTDVNVRDANDLSVSVAGDTTGDVRLQAGTALDVTSDINAGGAATLLSGNHMNAQAVQAGQAIQAQANAGGATFTGDVEAGTTATLEATGAALETQAVTANGGNASLTGASVTTAGNVTANGANADANINATAGAAQIGGAVTVGRDANINATGGAAQTGGAVTAGRDADINATAGANTAAGAVTAGRDATIAAGGGAAQVAAVTATAGNATVSGASVNNTGNVQAGGNAALVGGAGGTTVGGNVTAGGNAVVISDGGAATVNANATVQAANIGVQGATIANNGTYAANGQLALVQTGGQAVTLDDASLPAGAQTVGIRTAGDLTVESEHALTFGNASVTAGGRTVQADGLASTDGAVDVTAGGNITSSAITGANGTTVTTENGGAINVAGNLGQGGDTVVNANGADVTAGALASGGLLDVNNAGAVAANIAAGGEAQIQAGSLVAGNTAAGGNLTLEVGGAADVGQLAVGGDMNGVVGGQFQTTGGQVGSIGQGGAFQANGGFLQNGVLGSGAVNVQAANYQLNGNLDAGGAAVNIIAGGGIQGNGVLTGGALTLVGGAIGAAANPLQVVSANLQQITGNGVWLVDTAAGTIAINVINSTGNVGLNIPNAQVAGGGSITAGGDIDLTVNQRFGTLANPVTVSFGGTLTIDGAGVPLLHIVIDGTANPSDLDIIYNANGFAIWGNPQDGYQIVGLGPDKQRLINRALAFTVNTPELKSKQGVFGDPGMIHTKMSVSEARSLANMDMLSLSAVNFRKTWEGIRSKEGAAALRKWTPRVYQNNTPLRQKLEAVASEMETQPEIWVPGQAASERTDDRQ